MHTTPDPTTRLRPLSEGNRLQRAYARWAAPYYARLSQQQAAEAERIDRWLYSRRALGLWLGLGCAVLATGAGVHQSGVPLAVALLVSLLVWVGLAAFVLKAWLQPEKYSGQQMLRMAAVSLGLAYMGMVCGFVVGRWVRTGSLSIADLSQAAREAAATAVLLVAVFVLVCLLVGWAVALARRQQMERELADLRLVQERDHAARQASEAQLRLLQAQIQPHFIFNTLAAVQHWVDTTDPRAGPLLRSLTSFLRGSTELLARDQASVADEAALAEHYLAILQARLGGRLHYSVDIEAAVAQQNLPPGLLLSLVENAVEHGITPLIAGGTVQVCGQATASGYTLCVLDDGAGLPPGWQEGTGLANCRQRLAIQFGERAALAVQTLVAPDAPDAQGKVEQGRAGTRACISVQTLPAAESAGQPAGAGA